MSIEKLNQKANIPQLVDGIYISELMYMVWKSRKDLQLAFNLDTREGQKGLYQWYQATVLSGYTSQQTWKIQTLYSQLKSIENFIRNLRKCFPTPIWNLGKSLWTRLLVKSAHNDAWRWRSKKTELSLAKTTAHVGAPGANLIGYVFTESGMGEHIRMSAAALATTGIDFNVVNFDRGVPSRQGARLDYGSLGTTNKYKANIFHINADQILNTYVSLGTFFFDGRFNICYPFWELSKFPQDWVPFLDLVDEVWAPTRFVQASISCALGKTVPHMPVSIELPTVKNRSRKYFGIPDDKYIFLCTFDFFSYIHRKNPWAVVNAFLKAFTTGSENVILVVKVMNGNEDDDGWQRLKEISLRDKRIFLVNKMMARDELLSLKLACDCYVSLHRSEGLGFGPMEAMLLGKPTIVTNYSGNTDYSRKDNSCLVDYSLIPVQEGEYAHCIDQTWAEPDIEHAAVYMKMLANDINLSGKIGRTAQEFIIANHSPARCGALYRQRLDQLGLL